MATRAAPGARARESGPAVALTRQPSTRSTSAAALRRGILDPDSFGMSDAMAQGMTDMARAKNEGLDNAVMRTPENTTTTSFREWCDEVLKPAVLDRTRAAALR